MDASADIEVKTQALSGNSNTEKQEIVKLSKKQHVDQSLFSRRFLFSWLVVAFWIIFMSWNGLFPLFRHEWPVSLTMVFGSFIAGATAEGGGAVAFPVFTKALHIPAETARDFALAIQSVGMTCASLIIIRSGYPFLRDCFLWTFVGAAPAVIISLEFIAPVLVAPYPKIFFTMLTLCFGFFLAFSLYDRHLPETVLPLDNIYRRLGFIITGLIGGTVAGLVGSGADVILFVVLCLRYRIDERIGTRTTVLLMASVSIVGFLWRLLTKSLASGVLPMWWCAIPIVAFGAPLGARFCYHQSRRSVVLFLLSLIALEFITTLWLVPFDIHAILFSLIVVIACTSFMVLLWQGRYAKDTLQSDMLTK